MSHLNKTLGCKHFSNKTTCGMSSAVKYNLIEYDGFLTITQRFQITVFTQL